MTDEQMRKAIVEACGWKPKIFKDVIGEYSCGQPPDYPNDLNAMAEAIAVLEPYQRELFAAELCVMLDISHCFERGEFHESSIADVATVTARQRAEAFLRTIGKWEQQP